MSLATVSLPSASQTGELTHLWLLPLFLLPTFLSQFLPSLPSAMQQPWGTTGLQCSIHTPYLPQEEEPLHLTWDMPQVSALCSTLWLQLLVGTDLSCRNLLLESTHHQIPERKHPTQHCLLTLLSPISLSKKPNLWNQDPRLSQQTDMLIDTWSLNHAQQTPAVLMSPAHRGRYRPFWVTTLGKPSPGQLTLLWTNLWQTQSKERAKIHPLPQKTEQRTGRESSMNLWFPTKTFVRSNQTCLQNWAETIQKQQACTTLTQRGKQVVLGLVLVMTETADQ